MQAAPIIMTPPAYSVVVSLTRPADRGNSGFFKNGEMLSSAPAFEEIDKKIKSVLKN
jgi:hypothetical protein